MTQTTYSGGCCNLKSTCLFAGPLPQFIYWFDFKLCFITRFVHFVCLWFYNTATRRRIFKLARDLPHGCQTFNIILWAILSSIHLETWFIPFPFPLSSPQKVNTKRNWFPVDRRRTACMHRQELYDQLVLLKNCLSIMCISHYTTTTMTTTPDCRHKRQHGRPNDDDDDTRKSHARGSGGGEQFRNRETEDTKLLLLLWPHGRP